MSGPSAVFLDRDGTINVKPAEGQYVVRAEELRLIPGAAAAIRRLNDAEVPVIVITNQRGVALGRMTEEDLAETHRRLEALLADEAGAHLDRIVYCPHERGTCECRKPSPGMLLAAQELWPWIVLAESVTVGDSAADVQAGRAAGTEAIRIGREVPDLGAAVERILAAAHPGASRQADAEGFAHERQGERDVQKEIPTG